MPSSPSFPAQPSYQPYQPVPSTPGYSGLAISSYSPGGATYIPQAQGATAAPAAPESTGKQGKVSRRSLLIGAAGAAVVAAGGGGTLFYYLHSRTGVVTTPNGTPTSNSTPKPPSTPIPGPQKLIAGVPLLSLAAHKDAVAQVAWDKTGRYLATGSRDSHVMLWDLGTLLPTVTGQQTLTTPAHNWKLPDQVLPNALSWSNDGHMIAAVVLDQNIYVITANSDAQPQIYTDASQANSITTPSYDLVAWSPVSNVFAAHDINAHGSKFTLWQVGQTTGPQHTLSYFDPIISNTIGSLDALSWSVDGSKLAGHTDYGKEIIWDAANRNVLQTFTMIDRPQFGKSALINNECQAWSPTNPGVLATSDLDLVYIWDVAHNKQLLALQINEPLLKNDIHPPYIWSMSWSPNGRYLAVSLPRSPRIYIWDIQAALQKYTPKTFINQTMQFPQHNISNGSAINLGWSPNGRYIAVGYGDSTVIVWKVDDA